MKLVDWFKGGDRAGLVEVISVNPETGEYSFRRPKWILRPIFAWFDFWVGVYVDVPKRKVYVFPIPCVGVVFYWG